MSDAVIFVFWFMLFVCVMLGVVFVIPGSPLRIAIANARLKSDPFYNVPDDPAVKAVCDLIRDHPEEWDIGEHWAEHKGGLKIWIANWDLVWTREIVLPTGEHILYKADNCEPTRNHRAVHQALIKLKATHLSAKERSLMNYIAIAERDREDGQSL